MAMLTIIVIAEKQLVQVSYYCFLEYLFLRLLVLPLYLPVC